MLKEHVRSCKSESEFQDKINELVEKRDQLTSRDLMYLVFITHNKMTLQETLDFLENS